ncbi:6-pyruvoyl trahydropterin synthase family protein [Paenibacillus ginsengarvi]|uniref:6-carboxy-5,6,7,8-tetrahydropterin synthase n=1 Tax=Paenibacillus ginsengarvi TaxID=400777 RepID=A0A3B0BIN1_9BACL|nr:6-pyruvoyl tetrahydropterin synthase family protein [Paenibacillus ginsengarvi]RKN72983.1 6-pyruvoyl tetrahydropterin synthase family protein [Paenibacillus ginsengarvi]
MMQQIYPTIPHPYAYELNKDLQFAAAHYVPAEEAGNCRKLHGHTYFANITVAGDTLDSAGFLVNFSILKRLIHERFDHTVLNDDRESFDDQHPDRFPTTEVVARTICDIVQRYLDGTENKPRCLQVYLRETPTSYCLYRPKAGDGR